MLVSEIAFGGQALADGANRETTTALLGLGDRRSLAVFRGVMNRCYMPERTVQNNVAGTAPRDDTRQSLGRNE